MGGFKIKKYIHRFAGRYLKIKIERYHNSPFESPVFLTASTLMRNIYLYDLLNKVEKIEGNIVECGVGWGGSLFSLCSITENLGASRKIYGFDSFEGFPEPGIEDKPDANSIKKGRFKTDQEIVLQYLINSGVSEQFLKSNLIFMKGFFEDSLPKYTGEQIAFLHIDADLYQSYRVCLETLYEYVAIGGIVVFDEYQSVEKYPGCKKAVDEFFDEKKEEICKSKIIDSYYVVKQ